MHNLLKRLMILTLAFCISPLFAAEKSAEGEKYYQEGKTRYDRKNYSEAFPFFKKAADLGIPEAMTHLGKMYFNGWGVGHDHAEGRKWHEKAAALGSKESAEKLRKMDMHDHQK